MSSPADVETRFESAGPHIHPDIIILSANSAPTAKPAAKAMITG